MMKTRKTISTPSDEQLDVKKVIRNGLVLLSLAIIFLSGVALWTIIQITEFYDNKVNKISMQTHQLHMMRISSRERTLLSYAIISEKDPFEIDKYRMMVYQEGLNFTLARLNLIKFYLSENELRLLEKQSKIAKLVIPIQDEVLDNVFNENNEVALNLIREKIIPRQVKLIKILDELSLSIDKRYNNIVIKVHSLSQTNTIILVLISIVSILGAVYIFRQTTFRTSVLLTRLLETRKVLLKTVQELTQQKDASDHHAIVSIADKQGNITYINDKFCKVSGYSNDELIGYNHRIIKSDAHSKEFYQNIWNTISQGNVWKGKICNQHKEGYYYWVESTITPFLDDVGIPYQYVSIRTDITELIASKDKAEESNRAKSKFLSSMSHELRTPMNAVLGFAQLLKMDAKDDITKGNIEEILDAGAHLLELINQVLDLSKIESGMVSLSIDSHNLNDLLNDSLSTIKPLADNKKIVIDNNVDLTLNIKINVDKGRFKQILLNLLSNAIKYNRENGKVTIDCSFNDKIMLCLSISDTGKGLTSEQQSHLFKPFDRAGAESSNITGTGLGLVITKDLIEQMNGTIGLESEVGKGSRFWIQIPFS